VEATLSGDPTFSSLGLLELVPRFDDILQQASPHYRYAKSTGNGVALVEVRGDQEMVVTYFQVTDVESENFDGTFDRVQMRCAAGSNRIELL
jgi:hypothetical protein